MITSMLANLRVFFATVSKEGGGGEEGVLGEAATFCRIGREESVKVPKANSTLTRPLCFINADFQRFVLNETQIRLL